MKRYLSLLLSYLVFSSVVYAFQVTFDATVDIAPGGTTAGEYTINKDCVTMHIEQGVTNGTHYRFYKNKKVTFTSECGPITQIVFYCVGVGNGQYGPAGFTSNPPEYAVVDNLGIWTNSGSTWVEFTASNFQVRATKIVVTVGGEMGLFPPRITPAGGTYYEPIDVNINCSTEGAAIYYTTDGREPTTGSTLYTAPFTISESTTVKAISAKDGETSEVVTAQYEILSDLCLGDLEALPDGEVVAFNHELTVLYQKGYYLYVRGECEHVYNYGQIYGNTGQTYYLGDIIPPGWGGRKTTYDGRPELTNPTGFQPATRNEQVFPELITIPQVGESTLWHYVLLKDVYIDQVNQVVRDQEGNSCPYYPQLTVWFDPTELLDVYAIVTSYRSGFQLLIIEEGLPLPPPPEVCCLADLYNNFEKGKVAQFECPLTVIYHNGANLFVKDSCGEYGLIYGNNAGGPFENGDLILGQASWTLYQGNKQLANHGEWTKVGKTDPVEPIVLPVEELCTDMVYWFVKLENVTLGGDEYEPLIEDETGSVLIFNRFNVEIIEDYGPGGEMSPDVNMDNEVNIADINCIIDRILKGQTTPEWVGGDGTYDIIGFVSVYKGMIEIIPIKIVHHGGKYVLIGDVNGDGELNIADVNEIIDIILSD